MSTVFLGNREHKIPFEIRSVIQTRKFSENFLHWHTQMMLIYTTMYVKIYFQMSVCVYICIKLYLLNIPSTKERDNGNPLSETAIENGNAATNKTNHDNHWIVIASPMARVGSRRWTSKGLRCKGSGQPFVQISNPWNLFVSWYFLAMTPALGQPVDFSKMTPTTATATTKLV